MFMYMYKVAYKCIELFTNSVRDLSASCAKITYTVCVSCHDYGLHTIQRHIQISCLKSIRLKINLLEYTIDH